jgi:hypothetical protein
MQSFIRLSIQTRGNVEDGGGVIVDASTFEFCLLLVGVIILVTIVMVIIVAVGEFHLLVGRSDASSSVGG